MLATQHLLCDFKTQKACKSSSIQAREHKNATWRWDVSEALMFIYCPQTKSTEPGSNNLRIDANACIVH